MPKVLRTRSSCTSRAPPNPTKARKKSLVAKPGAATLEEIHTLQKQGKGDHGRAAATSKKYAEYIERRCKWLASHVTETPAAPLHNSDPEADEAMGDTEDGTYDDPEFKDVFAASVGDHYSIGSETVVDAQEAQPDRAPAVQLRP